MPGKAAEAGTSDWAPAHTWELLALAWHHPAALVVLAVSQWTGGFSPSPVLPPSLSVSVLLGK